MSLLDDMKRAITAIEAEPFPMPTATIHHPKCPAIASSLVRDCRCGGWAWPTRGRAAADGTPGDE